MGVGSCCALRHLLRIATLPFAGFALPFTALLRGPSAEHALRLGAVSSRLDLPPFIRAFVVTARVCLCLRARSWHVPTIECWDRAILADVKRVVGRTNLGTRQNPLVVLSLFDGIGVGWVSLRNVLIEMECDDWVTCPHHPLSISQKNVCCCGSTEES